MSTEQSRYLVKLGMPGEVANEITAQIDDTENDADSWRLTGLGMAAPLAKELAAQITAYVGNAQRLEALGIPTDQATYIAAYITASDPD